ncbi:MAG: hypothetical protein ACK56I_31880, partial [bacterium]
NADGAAKKIIGALAAKAIGAGTLPPIEDIPDAASDITFSPDPNSTPTFPIFKVTVKPAAANLKHFGFQPMGCPSGGSPEDWYKFDDFILLPSNDFKTGTLTLIASEARRNRPDFGDDEIVITVITKKKVR